jgi:biopolymer transport protein ExbD
MKSPSSWCKLSGVTLTLVTVVVLTVFPNRAHGQGLQQAPIPQGAVVINLDANGGLRLDQERIESSILIDRLHDISATRRDTTVVIVAAPSVPFKKLISTVEAVREGGIDRVGILKAQPDGPVRVSLPPLGAMVLSVDRSGVIRLDGKKMKITDVASQLQKLFKRRSDRTVYVQAHGLLSFGAVDNVIDEAKKAGASRIALLSAGE